MVQMHRNEITGPQVNKEIKGKIKICGNIQNEICQSGIM